MGEYDSTTFWIKGVVTNLVGIFGLIGNINAILILKKKSMKSSINYILLGKNSVIQFLTYKLNSFIKNYTIFFLLGLASSNSVYLILMIIRKSISDLFCIDKRINYPQPIATPLSNMAYNTSIYLTILLTFER